MADGIDLGADVSGYNEAQCDSEIGLIRQDPDFLKGEGSVIGGNKRATALNQRMEALYKRRYPETPERAAETGDNKGLHDVIKKTGLDSPEQIKQEAETGRQDVADQEAHLKMLEAEGTLRREWGEGYDQRLGQVHFALDNIFDPADTRKIIDSFGNSPEVINALSFIIQKFSDAGIIHADSKSYKRPKDGKLRWEE